MKIKKLIQETYRAGGYQQYCTVEWDDSIKSIIEPSTITGIYRKAICGCCENEYRSLPSQLSSILEKGYCTFCLLYNEGKMEYVVKYRPATVDEITKEFYKAPHKFSGEMSYLLDEIKRLNNLLKQS